MPAYIAVQVEVKDPTRYERYKQMAPASIAQYGGRYLAGEARARRSRGRGIRRDS